MKKYDYRMTNLQVNQFRKSIGLPLLIIKDRECMGKNCKKIIKSEGPHHRRCDDCRKLDPEGV